MEKDLNINNKKNLTAGVIKTFGHVTILVGSFLLFMYAMISEHTEYVFLIIIPVVAGFIFYAIAEIIQILHDIRYKLYNKK